MTIESRTFDDVAEIVTIDRFSPADKAGLLSGDIFLAVGDYAPSDVVANPELLGNIGRQHWVLLMRKGVLFKLAPEKGLTGCTLEPRAALEGIKVPDEDSWVIYNVGLHIGQGLLLLPERISPLWSLCPVITYARHRLWQMLCVTVLFYAVGAAYDVWLLAVTYLASVAVVALGGATLLRDAARSQGYLPRGKVGVTGYADAAALEVLTASLYKLERENAVQKTQKIEKMYGRQS